jgi:glycerol-3-phosphate O-acyltransferase/dihydroxyacetone phosphate acyltransferase
MTSRPAGNTPAPNASNPPGRGVVRLARLAVRVFFRSFEVDGAERVPRGRPLLVVANHVNGLVDPALLLAALPVAPRFLGKSTLWRNPALRPLLEWAGVIPVYRRQDGGDTSGNAETFARCHQILAGGGVVALFPEGISHNLPALAPLRTGAARIALEAERLHGPLGLAIVPVGLVFERKDRFRSRVLVRVGEALDPTPERARYLAAAASPDPGGTAGREGRPSDDPPRPQGDPRARSLPGDAGATSEATNRAAGDAAADAVRALTTRIDEALRAVTLNYPSWREARLLARAAELFRLAARPLPRQDELAARFDVARAFVEGYPRLRAAFPAEVAEVARTVERYDRLLERFRLRDEQVVAHYPLTPVLTWAGRTLASLVFLLPLALVGTVLNLAAWFAVDHTSRRFAAEPDQVASWKLLPALVAYPLGWLLVAVAAGLASDSLAIAGLTGLLAAATALPALRFHERRTRLAREARAFLLLRSGPRLGRELRARRAAAVAAVQALVARAGEPVTGGAAR